MNCIGTYDGTIFYNPANKFCIVSVKTADQSVPAEARSNRRYKDHLIRFTAVGYEIPRTDAVELELDGEWTKGKYGVQLQVEQWREIVPRTKNGVEGYLASGLIKGIGPKTAADIVERFGVATLDILEHQPERLLEIRGITENKLEDIRASYAENRMLQGIMTLLAPFKITPKTALKIYQYFGPTSVEILEKSPFELCQISGFGFRRVDAIVQKSGGNLHDPMRIKGAVFCALDEGKSKRGHLYISSEELEKSALKLLNEKIPVPELRLHQQEVRDMMQEMILNGAIVSVKDNIYLPRVFAQEDETARRIAQRLVAQMPVEHIAPVLEQVKVEMGLRLSAQQEAAVYAAFRHGLSVITGSPGTGKTTVLRTILEVYRRLYPDGKIALMAPTGRASRRMSESTGFEDARTLHSGLGLTSEEDEGSRNRKSEPLSADLIIVDEFSMVDMWLAEKFFERMKINARIVLVGDPDQLPSVGAGNVFREIIETKIVPVTVLDQIFRQSKDSLIAYNAKFINEGNTKLFYGPDFVFVSGDSQEDTAEKITERYCLEIQESGIENVQILSPFRSEGAASSEQLNETIRELVNPFRSAEEEIKFGPKIFRINDRIMQTKNTEKVSNGDLGFIRYIKDTDQGKKIGMDFGAGRTLEYGVDDLSNVDLAYATTIHKAMGSEYETVIMPLLKAHTIMMYLGLTKEEYQIFLAQGNQALKDILDSQRVFRRFCIYQLCLGETQTVPFAFKQLDALRKAGYEQPPAAAYQTVWSAEVCCPKGQNDMEVLGRLFLDYNEHLPEDYRGRPLAPSDVVELDCQGKRTYFYVNDCRDFAPVRFSPFLCTLPILVPMDQYYEIIQNFGEDRAVYNYRTYMNLLVEDGLDAEVQAQAEQICGTYLGTSDFYTSSKTQRALDRERLTDATMLIVYSLTALFGIIGISSAAVAILNSLYQRRKEFAMLRSVGLDRKGLDRLLHIEGIFLGGKPLVIGLPILFLNATVLMWMQDVTFMEFIQVFPLLGLAAYIVLVLMVISGIYRAASRRIRRDIIVEVLKDENV